jgi:hypothetical protein
MNAFMLMQKARASNGVAAKLCSLSRSAFILKTILVLIQRDDCPKDRHFGRITRRDHLSSLLRISCMEICGLNKSLRRIEAICKMWFSIDIWH